MERRKPYKLDEASLARAYQHVNADKNVKSWGMITAFRSLNTPKENRKLNKQLESDLRSKKLGFFKVEGRWRECQNSDINYADCPPDKLKDSIETTFFVPNIAMDDIHTLGKEYNQDSVLYGGSETKGDAFLIFRNGSHENVGKFHPNTIQQAYSKMRNTGKVFAFQREKGKKKNMANLPGSSAEKDDKLIKILPKDILNKNATFSIESYYKKSDRVVAYKDGASFLNIDVLNENDEIVWDDNLTAGQGWSYGTEFLLQRSKGPFSGWIGYTLSWTQLQFDEINFGKKKLAYPLFYCIEKPSRIWLGFLSN